MSNEGQELSWFDMAFKQLTEVIPVIGTRSIDVLGKLAEVIPKVGRVCDHASVFLSKATERLDKPVAVRFDQAQLKQVVDDYGEMLATVAEVAVLKVLKVDMAGNTPPTCTDAPAKRDVVPAETISVAPVPMVVEALKSSTPVPASDTTVSASVPESQQVAPTAPPLVDLSVLTPKGDCADCTAIGMLCEVHVKDPTVVEEAGMQVSSWLDDRDADGSLGREPLLKHFKRLTFATKAAGDECERDCMSCTRVTDAGIPRPVQCLRDVAKLVPVVNG